jgi:hypothetical protein
MPPKKGDKHPHEKHPAKHAAAKKHEAGKPAKDKHSADEHPKKKHGHKKDLRRAFEHMSRVQHLRGSISRAQAKSIDILVALAHQELIAGGEENAADLLRATEHLGFAFIGTDASVGSLSPALLEAIAEQYQHLGDKATEHWDKRSEPSQDLSRIYASARKAAGEAFAENLYHQALEYQRAAEALAHVDLQPGRKLQAGRSSRQLKAS